PRFIIDDPNIIMKEYIRLQEEKAPSRGETFDWQTAKYDSENENDKINMPSFLTPEPAIGYIDDLDFFKDFENEFPAIAYNDDLKSKSDPRIEPSIWHLYHLEIRGTHSSGTRMSDTEMGLDVADTLCFQLGGARRRMTWRQFILALGLHTEEEMAEAGFGAYWHGSERVIPDKGDANAQ
ncbi:hypothetical protein Tco_1066088, partial [Tanacetum coccineum]